MAEIIRENPYMYIIPHNKKGWYVAKMKGMSVSQVGNDLNKLEKEFTKYVLKTFKK